MTLILGIDDAGRGPIIGPMILSGILIEKDKEKLFKNSGITDSKLISHPNRVKLFNIINILL